jgi:hypothetical protein
MIRRLRACNLLQDAGSYRQRYSTLSVSGFRVSLYRIEKAAAAFRPKDQPPIGKRLSSRVRFGPRFRPRWWQHELFGDASGRPPPGLKPRFAARIMSPDERECPWAYGLAVK